MSLRSACHHVHKTFRTINVRTFPPLRGLQVSRRVRRDQDDGPQAAGHARGQAPIALVMYDGVRSAHFLHHQHGRNGHEALGPGAAWLGETEAGRTGGFISAADMRNLTISTVVTMTGTIVAQLIVEGATKRVAQDLPEHEKQLQREPVVHREHVPGADRLA